MVRDGTVCDKDRILADQTDIFPFDDHIVISSEKTEQLWSSVNYDGYQSGVIGVDFYVIHKADPTSVGTVNDFLMAQICYPAAVHRIPPAIK